MMRQTPLLALLALLVVLFVDWSFSQECTTQDFAVLYNGLSHFSVSSLNGTCACNNFASAGANNVGGSLNVAGAATFRSGVSVTGGGMAVTGGGVTVNGGGVTVNNGGVTVNTGGLTVANGQTVNIDTSLSSTPFNVWGLATLHNGLTVSNGAPVSFGTSGSGTPVAVFGSVTATSFIGSAASLTNLASQPEFAAVAAKVNALGNSSAVNAVCQTTSDCSGALVCHRGSCKVRLGNACTSHQQCMTDVHGCFGSVCSFYTSCSAMRTVNPGAASGYYPIVLSSGRRVNLWCNFETADEGWTVVWSNHRGGSGKPMTNMPWTSATSGVFQWKSASTTTAMPLVPNPEDFGQFVGLSFWAGLAPRGRLRYDWSNDYGQPIVQRYECAYTLTGAKYTLTLTGCVQRVGSQVPGLVATHSGYQFSTADQDNDVYTTSCSGSCSCALHYSGSPWWYSQCWSGNINGGGENSGDGHFNGAYWYGSEGSWGSAVGLGAGNGWLLVS